MNSPKSLAALLLIALLPGAQVFSNQDAPIRKVAEVTKTGEQVLAAAGNKALAKLGYLDATAAPYHADATGKTDATAAIQQALKDARDARLSCYLPAGRYLVSDTISGIQGTVEWASWPFKGFSDPWLCYASSEYPNVLLGPPEGKRAVLVLADHAPGFGDPANPKPVVHFWARMEYGEFAQMDKTKPQPNINFNQRICDLDFELGQNNPGAVAINHQGAEGSTIADVNINAEGAFAGIQGAPGSGGGIFGVSVTGGRYGFYFRSPLVFRGSQPSPVVSAVRLTGQTEQAILFDGRGPLTVVGAAVAGAGIRSDCPSTINWNGALNIVDTVFRMKPGQTAIRSNHSVVLDNVSFENAATAVQINDERPLAGNPAGWLQVKRAALSAVAQTGAWAGGAPRRDGLWVDGAPGEPQIVSLGAAAAPDNPDALINRHAWPHPFPSGLTKGAVSVMDAPYLAKGDGVTDDAGAIQRAIDENDLVLIPKGRFAISAPLKLRAKTKLVGLGNVQTVITPTAKSKAFADPDHPLPLIETVDDAAAETTLAFLQLLVPADNPSVYALCWRAGRNSLVREIYPIREQSHPDATSMGYPMVRIEQSGGGRWYSNVLLHWWDQGPTYRHLLVDGTTEPLRFYMLEPQHGRGEYMVEMRNSRNIDVFAIKAEGDYNAFLIDGCSNLRIFGYGGNGMPRQGFALFNIRNSRDYLLANINPQYKAPGHTGALGTSHNPANWHMLRDSSGQEEVKIKGTEQFAYFIRGLP